MEGILGGSCASIWGGLWGGIWGGSEAPLPAISCPAVAACGSAGICGSAGTGGGENGIITEEKLSGAASGTEGGTEGGADGVAASGDGWKPPAIERDCPGWPTERNFGGGAAVGPLAAGRFARLGCAGTSVPLETMRVTTCSSGHRLAGTGDSSSVG